MACGQNVISRMMMPDNANAGGNVHGGEVLKLMEEAGHIVATRHCNSVTDDSGMPKVAVLARVEQMDFLKPMFIGEVAHVSAEITFASQQSIEVKINVWAESVHKNERRFTNRATLWYVAVKPISSTEYEVATVPPITYKNPQDEEDGQKRFEFQKKDRRDSKKLYQLYESGKPLPNDWDNRPSLADDNTDKHTVRKSQSTLIHSILPSDCYSSKYSTGGAIMKLMDSAGGLAAIRHSNTPCVTASIDAINFHHPMKLGNVVTVSARVTFTSAKSMEIEVIVVTEDLRTGAKHFSCTAFFNFVSVDNNGRVLPVPPLILKSNAEQKRFDDGKQRYLVRKQRRLSEITKN